MLLARAWTSTPRLLPAVVSAGRPVGRCAAASARRAVATAAGGAGDGASPSPASSSSGDSGAPALPPQARTSEDSAISLRAVRQRDQLASLQSKLAGGKECGGRKRASLPRPALSLSLHSIPSSTPHRSSPLGEAPTTRTSAVLLAPDEAGWRELDEKVNEYPEVRVFKGIGTTAGDERARFEAAMVRAIEGVVGVKVPPEAVVTRDSSAGKYVSVSVEVTVQSGEEVAAVFTAIKKEAGGILKWLM